MQTTHYHNSHPAQIEAPHCVKCGSCHTSTQCTTFVEQFFWTQSGDQIYLVGEWSNWKIKHPMVKMDGYFTCQVSLNPGSYQHRFIVDGQWRHDQTQPNIENTLGSKNNMKEVIPKRGYLDEFHWEDVDDNFVQVTIYSNFIQEGMKIIGSWDGWINQMPLHLESNLLKNTFMNSIRLKLEKGKRYEFKFKDSRGEFFIDEKHPAQLNEKGTLNNYIIAACYLETKTPKKILETLSRSTSFNETEWQWEKQPFEELQSYNLHGHSLTCIGDMLYIFGGIYKNQFRDYLIKVPLYDLSNFQQQKGDIASRAFHTSVADGNKIIIFGGLNTMVLNDCTIYNTATDEWSEPLAVSGTSPSSREKSTSVLYKDSIIVYGGYYCCPKTSIQIIHNDIHILNTQSMAWNRPCIEIANSPSRFAHSATVYEDSMLVFGGTSKISEDGVSEDCDELWKLKIEKDQLTWNKMKTIGQPPSPRHGHTANILIHYLVIFGGASNKQLLNDVIMLDLNNLTWIKPTISGEIPRAVAYHAATQVNNELIVIGGKVSGAKYTPSVLILKPKRERRKSFSVYSKENEDQFWMSGE